MESHRAYFVSMTADELKVQMAIPGAAYDKTKTTKE